MKKLLLTAAAAAAFAAVPANAAIVSVAGQSNATLAGDYSAPGLLSFDMAFDDLSSGYSALSLNVELEDGDIGSPLAFNAVVDNLAGLATEMITVELDGATFSSVGSLFALYSPSASGALLDADTYVVSFGSPGDTYGIELGDTGFGGTDFGIDFSTLEIGDSFNITIFAGEQAQVPAPPAFALFGLAGAALVARRRRAKTLAA